MQLVTKDFLESLVPKITIEAQNQMIIYHTIYEKYSKEISDTIIEDLKTHPVFGQLIASFPREALDARSALSIQLQKDAILNNNWLPHIQNQIEEGIGYAKMGFDFKSWFELVTLMRDYMLPYLKKEYSDNSKFFASLNGMNRFMDIGMTILGEAYLIEKQEIIQKEHEEVEKLNAELELKVIHRTAELASVNKELENVNKELQAVNKELEAFTFSVSHDLRAPLRAINGYTQILAEDYSEKLDEEANNVIKVITRNTKKMGVLIDDLLTFSRLGRREITKAEVNMDSMVKIVFEELGSSKLTNLVINRQLLLPARGDYALLKQVWINLIANAIKFSEKVAKPQIEIGSMQDKDGITYYVKDNGVGFDMQYYNKLFGVFQRLHAQDEFEGTGIGLAIVQRIINAHKGTVWAESELNKGACFFFKLPIVKAN